MMETDERTHISKLASSAISATLERVDALRGMSHHHTQGELTELLLAQDLIEPFLTSGLKLGTGVIVNSEGTQSKQTDIVIYDGRVLPAFVERQRTGIYPVESVLATVEVKTELKSEYVSKAQEAASHLLSEVWHPAAQRLGRPDKGNQESEATLLEPPLSGVIAFDGAMPESLGDKDKGKRWLNENGISKLFAICVVDRFCWARTKASGGEWSMTKEDSATGETKRFLALLLDNVRTVSERRSHALFRSAKHYDWFSQYIRDDVGPQSSPSAEPSLYELEEGQRDCATSSEVD